MPTATTDTAASSGAEGAMGASAALATPARVKPTSISSAERSLAPDLARGFMLLFIALANVPLYLWGRPLDERGLIEGSSTASKVIHMILEVAVNERSRPMFAILYGFGLAMIASRFAAKAVTAGNTPEQARKLGRKLLAKRSLWLIAFGLVHASFLFFGDILMAYGITGLVALGFVLASDRTLKIAFWVSTTWLVFAGGPLVAWLTIAEQPEGDVASPNGPDYTQTLLGGVAGLGVDIIAAGLFGFVLPLVLGGVILFRAGWLTKPEEHLPHLRRAAVWGIGAGLVTAAPIVLSQIYGWETATAVKVIVTVLYLGGGSVAGLGYICLFALIAHRLRGYGRRGAVRAISALGERSLTGYLTQSIICAPLLSSWGLNLAEDRGYGFAAAFAVGTWLVTVAIASGLDRAGRKGPFEVLLRKLSYR